MTIYSPKVDNSKREFFDDLFPLAVVDDEPIPGLLRSVHLGHCEMCGAETRWIDLDFQCFVCSTNCMDKLGAER